MGKVHTLWEGHKILRNLHRRFVVFSKKATKIEEIFTVYLTFTYIHNVKSMVKISFIFVAFLENMNFNSYIYVEILQNFVAFSEYMNFIKSCTYLIFKPKVFYLF